MSIPEITDTMPLETPSAAVPLTLAGAARMAASLHGSLLLAEILRGCTGMLQEYFRIDRLTLVQHRINESAATVYSVEDHGDGSMIGPRVIVVEPSRLKQCIIEQRMKVVRIATDGDQDVLEQKYLLCPGTGFAVYLPLLLHGRLKGVLVLALPDKTGPSPTQRALLSYLSGHLALAIENSDHHYMECRRSRQLEMVSEISRRAVRMEDLDVYLEEVVQLIRTCFDYDLVQIWTDGSAHGDLAVKSVAYRATYVESPSPDVPWMVRECHRLNQTLCSNGVPLCNESTGQLDRQWSQLAVPVRIRGKLLAVLYLESVRLDAFPVEDLSTMEGVASLIASTYDNLWAFEHAQQSNEYMQAILESAKDLAIISTDTQGLIITSSVGSESIFEHPPREILGTSILSLFSDAPFRKALTDYIRGQDAQILERKRLRQRRDGRKTYLDVTVQRVYDPAKCPVGFLCIAADVTENVQLQEQLEALSITDELTGFYNRRRFFAAVTGELERCRRFNRRFSLCFLDLDGFKSYNDLNGHRKGDEVLRDAARLVMTSIRAGVDTCYRYGGDEFIIIMPETNRTNARLVAERIREQLEQYFSGGITASIGITESGPFSDVEKLLERADRSMYKAKAMGGNRTVLSDEPGTEDLAS